MITQLLTGEDTRFLAQQPEYETDIMVGQMTTLMQNITDLQNDTDDKVAQLQNQSWFKRMTNTLFGKNKVTKHEIQKNNDKVVTYISQSVAQLYNMNLINERAICSLGNRMNEVYMQVVESNQEMLNMKGQISQIMAVQQQTMEALGAFVNKLNEKIESVDNFHMLISEIQNGMYNDSSKLYNLCSILSQLDKRQMNDNRKMNLLIDTMKNKAGIITSDKITVLKCLQEIVALPQEKIGLIYLELCNFRNSFPAGLFADMIENYHFLSKMEKMSKKKEVIIQRVLDKYDLDSDALFSIEDISESFFENKQACLVDINNLQIEKNSANDNNTSSGNSDDELEPWSEELFDEKLEELEDDDEGLFNFLKPYAEQGIPEAMYWFADYYEETDSKKFIDYLTRAAEAGFSEAQCDLGKEYYYGNNVSENENKAFNLFKKSAENGNSDGQFWTGICYYEGYGVRKNIDEAIKWLTKSAEQEDTEAMGILGNCFVEKKNFKKAIEWYKTGAEKYNDGYCQNSLGLRYYNGEGVKQSYSDAFFYFKRAAENGDSSGENNLGYCYMNGYGTSKNLESARYWLEKAVEDGFESAQESLDELDSYYDDYDSSNKTAESLRYWADNGDLDAMEDLGYALYFGELDDNFGVDGIEQDYNEAVKWFEKAANAGMMYSQKMFGDMCYNGEGVQQNYQRAMKWYKKAAEQGSGWACFQLYVMYFNGQGCSKNEDIGIEYYYKACNYLNDGKEICPDCGSSDYSLEEVSSGAGKGAAVGAGAGAMFGLIGMAVGAAAGALINNSTTTNCRCNNCGYQWEKIM
mgnify:FL=1